MSIQTLRIEYKSLQQASGIPASRFNALVGAYVPLNASPSDWVESARAYVHKSCMTSHDVDIEMSNNSNVLPPSITGSKGLWV